MDAKNFSIDGDRAKAWEEKVSNEIKEVRALLKEVQEAVTTPAGEDDTIMQGVETLGKTMDKIWTEMCDVFEKAQESVADGISWIIKAASNARESIDILNTRINK